MRRFSLGELHQVYLSSPYGCQVIFEGILKNMEINPLSERINNLVLVDGIRYPIPGSRTDFAARSFFKERFDSLDHEQICSIQMSLQDFLKAREGLIFTYEI